MAIITAAIYESSKRIWRVGTPAVGTTSATIPAHQQGDLIIIGAFRDGNNTSPALPSGQNWTNLNNVGANTCSMRVAYKFARDSNEVTGTFTSATTVIVAVYRNVRSIGASTTNGGASTTVNYPAISMQNVDNTSWVCAFAGHRSTNTSLETAPSNMVFWQGIVDATDEMALHDTLGGVTSWTSQNVSVGGTSSGWRSSVIELRRF
jgi:hypothetical protein